MSIHRDEEQETDDQRAEREEKENAAEASRLSREKALEDKSRADELRAAKAEAALEESRRRGPDANSQPVITEEQWRQAEERTGKTRDQIIADANLQQGMISSALKPVLDEVRSAREEARAAKEETARIKARKGLDSIESDFYKNNRALEGHKGAVQDVLDSYPDKDSVDPETYKKRLELARDVVKGRVKETMTTRRRTETGSARLDGGDREERVNSDDEESDQLDPRGLPNKGARVLMEGVLERPGGRLTRGEDTHKDYKRFRDEEGRGVRIDDSDEWERGEQIRTGRDRIGGNRGAR